MYCGIDQRVTEVNRLPSLVDILNLWLGECELLGTCNWKRSLANSIFLLQESIFGILRNQLELVTAALGAGETGCRAAYGAICGLHEMNGPLSPTWNLVTAN